MPFSDEEFKKIEEEISKINFPNKESKPLLSVIIPTYNSEKFLLRCLKSVSCQTLKNIEIVVIDDGSYDDTEKIITIFKKYDKRMIFLKEEHKMQGAARNFGIKTANGEYIGFVDSDDWIDLDYFEKLYNGAKKYNSDLALAVNVRIGNGKTKKRINIDCEKFINNIQEKIDICKLWRDGCPTNKIYRRNFLIENDIFFPEGVYCEDKLFSIKAVYFSNGITTIPNCYYYYFRNPFSTVKNKIKKEKRKNDKNNARLEVLNFLREKNADIRDKDFWAITDKKGPFLKVKESLHTKRFYIFSFIKIYEKKI